VETSLLGAGMLLHSGVFRRDGSVVRGPALGADQTGYGPGHRLYRCAGGTWLAVVVPDPAAWAKLATVVDGLPETYAPLRGGALDGTARPAEAAIERALAARPAADREHVLSGSGELVAVVDEVSRDAFRRRILDDPLNRRLGRAVTYDTADWGAFEQIGPLLRCGPGDEGGPSLHLPGVGEHTVEVLAELGFSGEEIDALLASGVARQGER